MDPLRAQHSVFYASSTSEIKDDLNALVACMVRFWTRARTG